MDESLKVLRFALEKYPERVESLPLAQLVVDSAREKPKRAAYLKLAVPDALVQAVRSPRPGGDSYLLVRIPADVGDRVASRIVLPGEA
ncbi:MAG: hypothetical protein ACE5EG_09645 [Thermoanaerobaculia bacterium]